MGGPLSGFRLGGPPAELASSLGCSEFIPPTLFKYESSLISGFGGSRPPAPLRWPHGARPTSTLARSECPSLASDRVSYSRGTLASSLRPRLPEVSQASGGGSLSQASGGLRGVGARGRRLAASVSRSHIAGRDHRPPSASLTLQEWRPTGAIGTRPGRGMEQGRGSVL